MTRFKLIQERQEKILALSNSSQVRHKILNCIALCNSVKTEFLPNYIKGLLHPSQWCTNWADEVRDLAKAFDLDLSCESNSDSRGSSEVDSDNVPVANVTDVLLSTEQVFPELGGPYGAVSQGSGHAA